MTPKRSDSEQPRTANDNTGDSLRDGMAAAYNRGLADGGMAAAYNRGLANGRAEAGAASLSEPLRLATPQRSDSEQPRTAAGLKLRDELQDIHRAGYIGGTTWERIEPAILAIEAEAGAASPSEPLQRLHRAVAGLPVHMGHGAIRAIEVLELIEAEQRAALAAPSQEPRREEIEAVDEQVRLLQEGVPNVHRRLSMAQERASEPAGLDTHPRTYSLTASGPSGELFLVTDDESGINIGHANKIGGPLTAPTASAAAHERPADAALNDPRVQHILDIAKKAAEYGRATNGSGKRMTGSLEVALARLDNLLQWEGEHPQAHARLAAQPPPEPDEQEGT